MLIRKKILLFILGSWFSQLNLLFAGNQKDLGITADSCNSTVSLNRTNLGLYGGDTKDMTTSGITNRIFFASSSPWSLLYSDDSCNSWHKCYPPDSLLYECEQRGWGGGGKRILSNVKGWAAAHIGSADSLTNASIISYFNGDSGSWKTAVDRYLLNQLGYSSYIVSGTGLSDYWFYSLMGPLIIRVDSGTLNSNNIIDITKSISGIDTSNEAISIAISNTQSGYPFYVVIDTSSVNIGQDAHGILYKYDGTAFSAVSLPSVFTNGIANVYTHPAHAGGDTLFISGRLNDDSVKIYRSFDGGVSWTDISVVNYTPPLYLLADVDYSPFWNGICTSGLLLNCGGMVISKDLGNTWVSIQSSEIFFDGIAAFHDNINIMLKSFKLGVALSTGAENGPFNYTKNEFLEAVQIKKIAKNPNQAIVYIVTNAGLAYTEVYKDSLIDPYDKWRSPYGEYPIAISNTTEFSAIAINPYDVLNVVAGDLSGFYTSTTGPSGFNLANSGYNSSNEGVHKDILFIDSATVLAVTGRYTALEPYKNGNIWRSTDKGLNWTIITPLGFKTGNSIVSSNGKIYISSGLINADSGYVWMSVDMGNSWTTLNGPTSTISPSVNTMPIIDMAIDPRGSDSLWILASTGEYNEVFFSADGANTYTSIANTDTLESTLSSIAVNYDSPDTIYFSHGRYIFEYDAMNKKNRLIFSGLPNEVAYDLAYGSMLAGTTTGFYSVLIDEMVNIITPIKESHRLPGNLSVFPNPFTDEMQIKVNLPVSTSLNVCFYNILGEKMLEKRDIQVRTGENKIVFSTSSLAPA
jgi:hypothetical protein